jgi:Phage integrase family
LIFASETEAPLDPENFSRSFAKLCSRAGLGHWHPHELRHSGASLMLAQGTPLHVVSEILGHASITITKDVYGHLVEGDRRAVAASMSQALFGPEPGAVAPSVAPTGGRKDPSPERVGACDLGALGGTRTPSLLIR